MKNSTFCTIWLIFAFVAAIFGDGGLRNDIVFWACLTISQVYNAARDLDKR